MSTSTAPSGPEPTGNPNFDPSRSVLDAFRLSIAHRLIKVFPELDIERAYDGVDVAKKDWDFTVPLPKLRLPGKPVDLGPKFSEKFEPDEWIESLSVQGVFLHFKARSDTFMSKVLNQIHQLTHETASGKPEYGQNEAGKGKKLILEYSSPNIAKEFHVGHLRSTIIGAFLANLYSACGWEVISMNYLGDWGKQFGLIAVGFEKYGSEEELERDAIKHLYDVYVKINNDKSAPGEEGEKVDEAARAYFKRMEDGDESALKHWRNWRDMSIEKYKQEYEGLNVKFDVYSGESQVGTESQASAIARLEEMGLVSESKGAKVIDLEKYKMGKTIVRKADGTSIYLTRDIGAAIERYEKYKFDKMIYVIANQQDLHVAQFFKVLHLMEYPWASRLEHVNFGMVLGMSTRKGTAVFLKDIIREAGQVMHEQMRKNEEKYAAVEDPEETSRAVGITAIKIQDMTGKRINSYNFSWERMTSFEGDTGPYLQYAHVRLASMERKNPNLVPLPARSSINIHHLSGGSSSTYTPTANEIAKAREIVSILASYPDVIRNAIKTQEPSNVVTYCFKLSHAISSAWEVLQVKGVANEEVAVARLWLFVCARDVLGAAMRLLSLTPLERM